MFMTHDEIRLNRWWIAPNLKMPEPHEAAFVASECDYVRRDNK